MALSTSTKLADVRSDRLSAQAEWETSTLRDFLVNNLVKESSAAPLTVIVHGRAC
jgi:hypothetical protein